MPELPEVEGAAAHLRRWTAGRAVVAFEVLDPTLLVEDAGDGSAIGARPVEVGRRAKHLLFGAGAERWWLHLRMTGELVRGARGGRARWVLDDGSWFSLLDPRRMAELRRVLAVTLPARFAALGLGPEPWPEARDGAWWGERLAGAKGALKPVLMDQSRVAGLGNIAAAEICWEAGLSPLRPAGALTPGELSRLASCARRFLDAQVEACSAEPVVYVNRGGPNPFAVYQQDRCPRCRGPVARLPQGGRTTWWCPSCQR